MAQKGYDGLERGLVQRRDDKQTKLERFGSRVQQRRAQRIKKSQPSVEMNSPKPSQAQQQCKSSQNPQRRNQTKWATNGPGMQALFLSSGPKPCGTGVFIPRTQDTTHQFNRKPAFSPVLLPTRVVQTLNLNVRELDRKTKPQPEQRKNVVKKDDKRPEEKKEEDDVIYISPEIILPKEWTY